MNEKLRFAATQAIETCMGVQKDEHVLIITDRQSKVLADALIAIAEKRTKNLKVFLMEDFGKRPDNPDKNNPALEFPVEMDEAMREADVSFYLATTRKGELQSFRLPLRKRVELEKSHLRHAHMPGITQEIMEIGLGVDYGKIRVICANLYEVLKTAQHIQVTTPAGTNMIATFDHNLQWRVCDGHLVRSGDWSNLPDGEVFTCPKNVQGTIVVDGVLGDFFDKKYGLLGEHPVTLDVQESRVQSVKCDNRLLAEEFEDYIQTDSNSNRFGEFAIGCNLGLKDLVGNLLLDEKFPGVHLAVGDAYAVETGANWSSTTHCDMVLRQCTIVVDGKTIMTHGIFSDDILRG